MESIAAIIGAGLIGRAWAMVFARAGWRVRLYDNLPAQLDLARGHIANSLAEQQAAGLVDDAAGAAARVSMVAGIEDAIEGAEWVQENLPEQVEVKRDVFRALDALAPAAAILASSTSAIPASHFTEALAGRARCLVAHPVNPPHLVPVVVELNAPGGVADYCARYGGFYGGLAADPPAPHVWDAEHVQRVVAALGEPPTAAERERMMTVRDQRLLALARHKRDQSDH